MPASQTNRAVSVSSVLGKDVLLFGSMSGSEQLGRLAEYRVQLLSTKSDIAIGDVLGQTMGIHLDRVDAPTRHFHGLVTRFRCTGWNGDFASYEAIIHPWLWLLTRSSNCRIFQDLSVTEIVKQVCADPVYGGVVDLSLGALSGSYDPLPYCVQYRETDFNFVCRLLEGAGIYFYFTHDENNHTMVLADSYGAHAPIAGYGALKFAGAPGRREVGDEAMLAWSAGGEIQSSAYTLNDFDFERTAASTSGALVVKSTIAAAFAQPAYEMYDYPGRYTQAASGTALARGRMESLHGQCERIDATSNARGLHAGGLFTLAEHPRDDQNRDYLITAAQYHITGSDYASSGAGQGLDFQCTLTAIGKKHSYRPPAGMTKPVVQGPQTAIVVGKAGEEIWTDKYGRVKVQFHWDRLGQDDERSSCWVRVAQGWAGKGWGAMFIPRVGMEVVVSFLEGDPDRPLVTGCVYNSDAMPPYPLPVEQTKSTLKSNSSQGGDGYNEIRFEDKKGAEEVYIQAEKDFLRVVKNNDTLKVGFEKADQGDQTISIKNDQRLDVGNDQTNAIKHDQKLDVGNDRTVAIKHDQKLDVGNDQTEHVGNDHQVTIGRNQTVAITGDQKITVSKTIVIEATTSIELKVGGSSIKIEPAKITIHSAQLELRADANAKLEAGAMMDLKAGGVMTVAGALVKIN
ncbi:MAG: type VI secretion system tip protein TssI/VgrG [Pseudomonadota bacterium]